MIKTAVLDGNAISRNLLTSVLESSGFHVVGEASSNPAGIAGIVKLQPQIVCVDVGDPIAEGMEKLDALRAELPKALLFLVSGKLAADTVQSALEHGVHGFIVKPFNASAVTKTIRSAIIRLAREHQGAASSSNSGH